MMANLTGKWMEAFVKETGGDIDDIEIIRTLLISIADENDGKSGELEDIKAALARAVERHAGPEEASTLSQTIENLRARLAVDEILIISLFKVLFGLSYTGLELNTDHLDAFIFPSNLHAIIPQLFNLLPAFEVPVTTYRKFSICCSVVQCGGYVLMPRVLAEERLSDIDSSPRKEWCPCSRFLLRRTARRIAN
jgi:hypothetical protein